LLALGQGKALLIEFPSGLKLSPVDMKLTQSHQHGEEPCGVS